MLKQSSVHQEFIWEPAHGLQASFKFKKTYLGLTTFLLRHKNENLRPFAALDLSRPSRSVLIFWPGGGGCFQASRRVSALFLVVAQDNHFEQDNNRTHRGGGKVATHILHAQQRLTAKQKSESLNLRAFALAFGAFAFLSGGGFYDGLGWLSSRFRVQA